MVGSCTRGRPFPMKVFCSVVFVMPSLRWCPPAAPPSILITGRDNAPARSTNMIDGKDTWNFPAAVHSSITCPPSRVKLYPNAPPPFTVTRPRLFTPRIPDTSARLKYPPLSAPSPFARSLRNDVPLVLYKSYRNRKVVATDAFAPLRIGLTLNPKHGSSIAKTGGGAVSPVAAATAAPAADPAPFAAGALGKKCPGLHDASHILVEQVERAGIEAPSPRETLHRQLSLASLVLSLPLAFAASVPGDQVRSDSWGHAAKNCDLELALCHRRGANDLVQFRLVPESAEFPVNVAGFALMACATSVSCASVSPSIAMVTCPRTFAHVHRERFALARC